MSNLKPSQFKFRRHDSIGAEGAEQDVEYLRECFVDIGDLAVLRDTRDPKRIVVGRTGSGKSALLLLLAKKEPHVSTIEPEQLSLNYLSNSTILRHLEELGVNLDLFYRLLWRHIFAVELIQLKYRIKSEKEQESFLEKILGVLKGDRRKDEALKYLMQWGDQFWRQTETRVHQVTERFERDLKTGLGANLDLLQASASRGTSLSTEQKREIVHRAQEIVNSVQIQQLSRVIDILAEDVFDDPKERHFVLVDRLDENWVVDPLRFKLIRALIETVKDLQRIAPAKIVVAIRRDLLQRVFRETRDAGFQEEKYQALYLSLTWTKDSLLAILEKRLNKLVSNRYGGHPVKWSEVFPSNIGKTDAGDYFVERTLFRPRDIIQFCNCCIELATDRATITAQIVKDAESKYSTLRFRGLGDEWAADYPELLHVADILKRRKPQFPIEEFASDQLDGYCLEEVDATHRSRLRKHFQRYFNQEIDVADLRTKLAKCFYEVGLVGIRTEPAQPVSWSFRDRDVLRSVDIGQNARVVICPTFYRVLGTDTR